MGVWKRRIAEKVRQNYGVTLDRGFQPTSNNRLSVTFAETKRFADALRRFDKQCTQHMKAVKDIDAQTLTFLQTPVPRMHKEKPSGEVEALEPDSVVGEQVDFDKMVNSAMQGDERIFKYVQEPLRKWLANFDTVVLAMQSVEQLRLTLDSRRRSVSALEGQLTNKQAKTHEVDDPKLMKLLDKKHRQEIKMNQVHEDFQRKELMTYQNMRHLVNDVKYVQQHIHKLFDLLRQIHGDVCDSFPLPNPLPGDIKASYTSHSGVSDDAHAAYGGYSDAAENQAPESDHLHEKRAHGALASSADDASLDEYGNRMDAPFGIKAAKHIDRYGDRLATVNQSGYNPV